MKNLSERADELVARQLALAAISQAKTGQRQGPDDAAWVTQTHLSSRYLGSEPQAPNPRESLTTLVRTFSETAVAADWLRRGLGPQIEVDRSRAEEQNVARIDLRRHGTLPFSGSCWDT